MVVSQHVPVMLSEVLAFAQGRQRVVDATAGYGGHVEGLLALGATVVAIDWDPEAISFLHERFGREVRLIEASFDAPEVLAAVCEFKPEFVLLDLGVSSQQLDRDERGFSFRRGVDLDMRMTTDGATAADLLNRASMQELRRILHDYADEGHAAALARAVVRRREVVPFETSDHLVNTIRSVRGPQSGPAEFARIFQAVRIAVNQELDRLTQALPALRDALTAGGRMAVITYHSGEDRIVKHAFRDWSKACVCPDDAPICSCRGRALGTVLAKKPIEASPAEVEANPRARSAKLRVFAVDA